MRRLTTPLIVATCLGLGFASSASAQETQGSTEQYAAAPESSSPPPLEQTPAAPPASPTRKQFYITPGFTMPLSRGGVGGETSGDRSGASPAAFLDMRWSPKENWFANVNLYAYPDGRLPWEPDFTYSFGYDDWRPNTFSLVYANYTNSRFSRDDGEPATRLEYGRISAGYKFLLPAAIHSPWDDSEAGRVNCRVGYHYTPRYETLNGPDRYGQQAASVGCRAPLWRNFFADLTAYDYLAGEQRPWDPDFTYSFGWFDWRPNHLSVQYTNYSGTRYPGRDRTPHTGRFNDGAITVTYNLAF